MIESRNEAFVWIPFERNQEIDENMQAQVPILKLNMFAPTPLVEFGEIALCSSKSMQLQIENPSTNQMQVCFITNSML